MKALDRKLLRICGYEGPSDCDCARNRERGDHLVVSLSTLDALQMTQAAFYGDYRFAHVFASLKRAPEELKGRLQDIPGVDQVETRVVAAVRLDVEGFADPITGQIISIPDRGQPLLNRLYLRQGRLPEPGMGDEAVASEAFAQAHGLAPGDRLGAIINGRRERLTVVGIALSPSTSPDQPGALFPDFERYGVLWMGRTALAAAYDMEGAFNDVVLTLSAGAQIEDVLDRIDRCSRPMAGSARTAARTRPPIDIFPRSSVSSSNWP
jgi:putative ABC transport system permease protein